MERDSLKDMEEHARNGAIPKRKRISINYSINGRRFTRGNDLDERNGFDFPQRIDCISGRCRDDTILKHDEITSTSIFDSGVFIDETTERAGSFPSPTLHRNGSVVRNNTQQIFGNSAYNRQVSGKEDKIEVDAGICHHVYKTASKPSGCFIKDAKGNKEKVNVNQGCGFHVGYGSIGGGVRRGSTKRGSFINADSCETRSMESRIEVDRRSREGERDGGFGDGIEGPGQDDAKPRGKPGSGGDSIGTELASESRSDSSESLKQQREEAPVLTEGARKWPPFLWIMFKFLGLFWARPVIKERYCHRCYWIRLEKVHDTVNGQSPDEQKPVSSRRHLSYIHTPEIGICDQVIFNHRHWSSNLQQQQDDAMESGESSALLTGNDQGNDRIIMDEGYSVNEHDEGYDGKTKTSARCRVCDALWWTGKGQYFKYTDKSIGLKSWNHCGSGMLSLVLLITYISLILYDAGYYASIYWGKKEDLIRYISYMSYLIFTGSVPAVCLFCLLRNAVTHPAPRFTQWPRVLDIRYVVRRLQYLDLAERGLPCKPFLVACTVFPLLIAFYRLMFYAVLLKSKTHLSLHNYLACLTTVIGLTLYGVFSYFIYILRISFYPQLNLDVDFIRHHVGELDVCRAKMSSTVQDFLNFRQLANGWMVMVIGIITWAIATQITWNYLLFSGIFSDQNGTFSWYSWTIQMYINGLMAMENMMFFLLPCFAIGGFNINIIWIRFRYRLLELRRAHYERFWYRLLQFIKEQDPVESSMRVTMLFTLISLFVALQFGEQNIYYYSNNITFHNIVSILPPHCVSMASEQPESVDLPVALLP